MGRDGERHGGVGRGREDGTTSRMKALNNVVYPTTITPSCEIDEAKVLIRSWLKQRRPAICYCESE